MKTTLLYKFQTIAHGKDEYTKMKKKCKTEQAYNTVSISFVGSGTTLQVVRSDGHETSPSVKSPRVYRDHPTVKYRKLMQHDIRN